MSEQHLHRLVTFLGIPRGGKYETTTYACPLEPQDTYQAEFVAEALVRFLRPDEVVVLATDLAWDKMGPRFTQTLEANAQLTPHRERLPDGGNEADLWSQFEVMKQVMRLPSSALDRRVGLDITFGFRSAPFFAAGVISFLQLIDDPPPEISVYYGALQPGSTAISAIWDLTPFSDLIAWSSDIAMFLKTGRAEGLAMATQVIGRSLRKQWAMTGRHGLPPSLSELAEAIGRFGADLETVRTGSLLLGDSSVTQLLAALEASSESAQAIPPLRDVLWRIQQRISPLQTTARLSEPAGMQALHELARLYLEMGRYAEAASTLRETAINAFASPTADQPGSSDFDRDARAAAERQWYAADPDLARRIADVRNDIEHAGYNRHPMPPATIKSLIRELTEMLPPEERDLSK